MDFKLIQDGLNISAIGLGFVFLVLFILTFFVLLLVRIEDFSEKRKSKNLKNQINEDQENLKNEENGFYKEIHMAAAAALALELDERENNTKNIVNINNKTSSWTYYSRTRQLLSRMGDNK
tara:strand:- start:2640 stop:3002 length:363 start_codon:yes stop_codon:yes gene_type:complete